MNAETAGHVGTVQSKIFLTGLIDMVYSKIEFPRGISDQVISLQLATAAKERAPGQGLKHQASSFKRQAPEASSDKRQAPSSKRQA